MATENVSASGLSASTTYYFHFVQEDSGNDSNVASSGSFTTSAGATTFDVSVSLAQSLQASTTASVTAAGDTTVNVSASGLTGGQTYYFHYVQNVSGIDSNITSSGSFTTTAVSGASLIVSWMD
jgi:phosphodiesterase/alkaline phosphatase D-like protein